MRTLIFTTLALTALLTGCGKSTAEPKASPEQKTSDTLASPSVAQPPSVVASDLPLEHLLELIERRLALAEPVALHKWDNARPVHAADRERQVVAHARNGAWRFKLSEERATAFMTDQIEANKLLQYQLLHHWQLQGEAPAIPRRDLQDKIRPQLDTLQAELLQSLADFDNNYRPDCALRLARTIDSRAKSAWSGDAMVRATGQLCQNP